MTVLGATRNYFLKILGRTGVYHKAWHLPPPAAVVLCYHDICEDNDYASWLRIKRSAFISQLQKFKEIGHFLRPDELLQSERWHPDKLNILLTFDDGYANNYALAFPLLQKFDIPALFFVSTWNISSGEVFWFDRVVCAIQENRLTDLDLQPQGLRRYRLPLMDDSRRWDSIQTILEDLKSIGNASHPTVQAALDRLDPGGGSSCGENCYQPLDEANILEMHRSGLCFFGSHSHRHDILTLLGAEDLQHNLAVSRQVLENLLGVPIEHISYPNGNVDARVSDACKETGYRFGYLTLPGEVLPDLDPLHVPRFLVGGYDSIDALMWRIGKLLVARRLSLRFGGGNG